MTLNSASNSFVSFLVLYFNFLSGTTFLLGGVIVYHYICYSVSNSYCARSMYAVTVKPMCSLINTVLQLIPHLVCSCLFAREHNSTHHKEGNALYYLRNVHILREGIEVGTDLGKISWLFYCQKIRIIFLHFNNVDKNLEPLTLQRLEIITIISTEYL